MDSEQKRNTGLAIGALAGTGLGLGIAMAMGKSKGAIIVWSIIGGLVGIGGGLLATST